MYLFNEQELICSDTSEHLFIGEKEVRNTTIKKEETRFLI